MFVVFVIVWAVFGLLLFVLIQLEFILSRVFTSNVMVSREMLTFNVALFKKECNLNYSNELML
jgi:hypothetical protein